MMNFSQGAMMSGIGLIASIMWIVVLIDLILLGIWLWQQIVKNN